MCNLKKSNRVMKVNLYKLHFPSFYFSFQRNKRIFYSSNFLPPKPNTMKKFSIFYFPTFSSLQPNKP